MRVTSCHDRMESDDLTLFSVVDVDPRPPPIIHQGPQNQTLPVDSVAMMVCSCSGSPKPAIRWYKNNVLLRMFDARITVLDSGTLQISGSSDVVYLIKH